MEGTTDDNEPEGTEPGRVEPEPTIPEVEVVDTTPAPAELGIDLPEDPSAAVEILLAEVASARQQSQDHKEDLQRVAADFENFRKRIQRDQQEMISQATRRVIEAMLPTLDSFDAAATHEPQSDGEEKLLAGLLGTKHQLMEVLSREGLEAVPAVGESFDPAFHEAISISGEGTAQVVESELRRGYRLGDRVIRPALVALNAVPEGGDSDGE